MAIGRPISLTPNIATKAISEVATADQTDFTVTGGYRINEIAVYRNGVRLAEGRDFTASDGSTVQLVTGATESDVIEFAVFDSFNIADAIVSAASSQTVQGDLNITGKLYSGALAPNSFDTGIGTFITALHVGTALTANAAGDVESIGIITAASFSGDGSALTGLANTDYVVSVATTTGLLNVTGTTDSTSTTTGSVTIAGGVGIAKNVYIGAGLSVAGTLTYEDVTSVDSVGLITAKSGVNITGGQLQVGVAYSVGAAGVATATGFVATSSPAININDGTTEKGYIGFNGNDPFIGRKNGVGLLFQNNKIRPADGDDGSATTNTADIGEPTYKFKDLYLEGEVNANGLIVGSGITFGSAGVATFSGTSDIHLLDNVEADFGDGGDLSIYHNGSNSIIRHNGTGDLYVETTTGTKDTYVRGSRSVFIQSNTNENAAKFIGDGAVELYYDSSKKFETTTSGVTVTGNATATKFLGDGSELTGVGGEFDITSCLFV